MTDNPDKAYIQKLQSLAGKKITIDTFRETGRYFAEEREQVYMGSKIVQHMEDGSWCYNGYKSKELKDLEDILFKELIKTIKQ